MLSEGQNAESTSNDQPPTPNPLPCELGVGDWALTPFRTLQDPCALSCRDQNAGLTCVGGAGNVVSCWNRRILARRTIPIASTQVSRGVLRLAAPRLFDGVNVNHDIRSLIHGKLTSEGALQKNWSSL